MSQGSVKELYPLQSFPGFEAFFPSQGKETCVQWLKTITASWILFKLLLLTTQITASGCKYFSFCFCGTLLFASGSPWRHAFLSRTFAICSPSEAGGGIEIFQTFRHIPSFTRLFLCQLFSLSLGLELCKVLLGSRVWTCHRLSNKSPKGWKLAMQILAPMLGLRSQAKNIFLLFPCTASEIVTIRYY